uniref:Uncharacterized protein n=1 Tax=Opuntia streptacantha TaxID=393608 RepID=A0A7C9E3W2_OPUST
MYPNPPALTYAHMRSQDVRNIKIGAEYFSRIRIPSIPFQTIANWASQKAIKQENSSGEVPSHGSTCDKEDCLIESGNKRKIASPPIHVSIPYHPHPTNARRRVGM